MKNFMKVSILALGVIACVTSSVSAAPADWTGDLKKCFNLSYYLENSVSGNRIQELYTQQAGKTLNEVQDDIIAEMGLAGTRSEDQEPTSTELASLKHFACNFRSDFTSELSALEVSLTDLTSLEYFEFYATAVTGVIPTWINKDNFSNLLQLHIDGNNSINGSIPQNIETLKDNLTVLHLIGNNLNGEIPSWIGNMTHLTTIGLNGNNLTGSIPTSLGALTELRTLDLNSNQLSGVIPDELGVLTELTTLNLSGNNLTGSIPNSILALNISNLTYDPANEPVPEANIATIIPILDYLLYSTTIPTDNN